MKLEVISISNKLTKWEDETLKFYLKQISSFANITIQNIKPLTQKFLSSGKSCSLIIGGSYGLSESFLAKSDHVISFSALTFPHKLFKILLIEQLYRSITIIQNKSYHK